MLLQTNSYIVPKERRAEHARVLRRFRSILLRLGCDQFEAYEQMGPNWNTAEATGRFVQIMRFRDRKHQRAVHAAEQTDPAAQQLINEFCELINLPYQQQQGLLAIGYYTAVPEASGAKGRTTVPAAEPPAAARKRPTTSAGFGFAGPAAGAAALSAVIPPFGTTEDEQDAADALDTRDGEDRAAEDLADEPLAEEPSAEEPLAEEGLAEELLAEDPFAAEGGAAADLADETADAEVVDAAPVGEAEPDADATAEALAAGGETSGDWAAIDPAATWQPADMSGEPTGEADPLGEPNLPGEADPLGLSDPLGNFDAGADLADPTPASAGPATIVSDVMWPSDPAAAAVQQPALGHAAAASSVPPAPPTPDLDALAEDDALTEDLASWDDLSPRPPASDVPANELAGAPDVNVLDPTPVPAAALAESADGLLSAEPADEEANWTDLTGLPDSEAVAETQPAGAEDSPMLVGDESGTDGLGADAIGTEEVVAEEIVAEDVGAPADGAAADGAAADGAAADGAAAVDPAAEGEPFDLDSLLSDWGATGEAPAAAIPGPDAGTDVPDPVLRDNPHAVAEGVDAAGLPGVSDRLDVSDLPGFAATTETAEVAETLDPIGTPEAIETNETNEGGFELGDLAAGEGVAAGPTPDDGLDWEEPRPIGQVDPTETELTGEEAAIESLDARPADPVASDEASETLEAGSPALAVAAPEPAVDEPEPTVDDLAAFAIGGPTEDEADDALPAPAAEAVADGAADADLSGHDAGGVALAEADAEPELQPEPTLASFEPAEVAALSEPATHSGDALPVAEDGYSGEEPHAVDESSGTEIANGGLPTHLSTDEGDIEIVFEALPEGVSGEMSEEEAEGGSPGGSYELDAVFDEALSDKGR
jgi:hypothetical protein